MAVRRDLQHRPCESDRPDGRRGAIASRATDSRGCGAAGDLVVAVAASAFAGATMKAIPGAGSRSGGPDSRIRTMETRAQASRSARRASDAHALVTREPVARDRGDCAGPADGLYSAMLTERTGSRRPRCTACCVSWSPAGECSCAARDQESSSILLSLDEDAASVVRRVVRPGFGRASPPRCGQGRGHAAGNGRALT